MLSAVGSGPIDDVRFIEVALAEAWGAIKGGEAESMAGWKLRGRMESVEWRPPILSFVMERHGGTVMGSTRAELQTWAVDVRHGSALCSRHHSYRQLRPTAERFDAKKPAAELARAIIAGADDPRLKWARDRSTVRVLVGDFIGGDYVRTQTSRRRRFRTLLEALLAEGGWTAAVGKAANTYARGKVEG